MCTGIADADGATKPSSLFEAQALHSHYSVVTWQPAFLSISATDVATSSSKCAHAASAQIPREQFVVKILLAELFLTAASLSLITQLTVCEISHDLVHILLLTASLTASGLSLQS